MENQEITSYEFTGGSLAENLSLKWDTLRVWFRRRKYTYKKNDFIPQEIVQEVLEHYADNNNKLENPEEVQEAIQEVAGKINLQINILNSNEASAAKPVSKQPQKPSQTNRTAPVQKSLPDPEPQADPLAGGKPVTALVYFAFIFILLYQVEHLATIGMDVSAFPAGSLARKVSGWLFAVTVSITALLMTLRRGIKARVSIFGENVSYLMVFAILDVIFFVLSSAPLEQTTALHWIKSLLVGITTAFVIYSFNELITKN